MKTVYLVRHGLIRSNIEDVYSGRSDEALLEAAVDEADRLGKDMRRWGISIIYASPIKRTVQTAETLNRHIRAKLALVSDLIEMDLGPWTGLSKAEVARRFPRAFETWTQRPDRFVQEGMENLAGIQERTVRILRQFQETDPDEIGAMISHAVVIKCAILHIKGLPLRAYHEITVPNLSVYKITFQDGLRTIERIR